MDEEKITQSSAVLNHLRKRGSITSREAFELYGATRLSGLIFNYKKHGINIVTEMRETTNRYGNKVRYARYVYVSEDRV